MVKIPEKHQVILCYIFVFIVVCVIGIILLSSFLYQKLSKFFGGLIVIALVLLLAWFIKGGYIKLNINRKDGLTLEAEAVEEGGNLSKFEIK